VAAATVLAKLTRTTQVTQPTEQQQRRDGDDARPLQYRGKKMSDNFQMQKMQKKGF
jgi:hypothetical protein